MKIKEQIKISTVIRCTIRDAKTGVIKRVKTYNNLTPTVGRAAIANQLTNASPSPDPLRVNYAAVGSSATSPANGDTTLGTEVFRNLIASQTNSNNVAYLTMFIGATEDADTYNEVGLFIGGTASADTGTLLSHAAISIVKSNTETLTIDWTITIS